MSKTFDVAGVSTKNGSVKFRVANGKPEARAKILAKDGHTAIDLFQLPKPMTKEKVFALLASKGYTESKENTKIKQTPTAKAPKTVKLTSIVKKVSKKFIAAKAIAATKEVPAEQLLKEVGIMPNVRDLNMGEATRIKTKNLETMRRVSQKLKTLREY